MYHTNQSSHSVVLGAEWAQPVRALDEVVAIAPAVADLAELLAARPPRSAPTDSQAPTGHGQSGRRGRERSSAPDTWRRRAARSGSPPGPPRARRAPNRPRPSRHGCRPSGSPAWAPVGPGPRARFRACRRGSPGRTSRARRCDRRRAACPSPRAGRRASRGRRRCRSALRPRPGTRSRRRRCARTERQEFPRSRVSHYDGETANSRHSPGHTLQLVSAAVLELDSRAGNEILDGSRDQHLAGPCGRGHARAHR